MVRRRSVTWHRGFARIRGMSSTADLMRQLIEAARLSQRQAADELGVNQRTFRDWCAGKSEPPKAVLLALRYLASQAKERGSP